jgi:hypothetical protein
MQDTDRMLDMFHKTAAGRKEENVMKRVAPMLQITAALLTFLFYLDSAAQHQRDRVLAGSAGIVPAGGWQEPAVLLS